ncbi:hypothetical protein PP175_29300 (plasmid) [Aneurinibacillus sp. Ricciae_BoGa-3]|uniref:hypothetical protein n=1 Tax=Aneurinibacillus sp. Ricciae_BoGa-3 TaxID=3022697 RepID=UPI00233FEF78|nr:hypothetical protein [Aneurinibacillus sp. Ricciae_BoGa-3]WCK57289.1 hypothetical protein PP175_29300 [Aneurinibacillus sp. Ricciae_BoGa-3]
MITITNGVLDVESAKKVFAEKPHYFQTYQMQKDGSLYPVDHEDVAGQRIDFLWMVSFIAVSMTPLLFVRIRTFIAFKMIPLKY